MSHTSLGLLDRLQSQPDSAGWYALSTMYEPFIRRWLGRLDAPANDVDDLVQEVLMVVLQKLAEYQHNGQTGAFRKWLRMITVNCLRTYWKSRRQRAQPMGGSDFQALLLELEDPISGLATEFEHEHDRHLLASLLLQIKKDFTWQTWQAFERLTIQQQTPQEVAEQLKMTPGAIYAAKSRVMTRLRQLSGEMIESC